MAKITALIIAGAILFSGFYFALTQFKVSSTTCHLITNQACPDELSEALSKAAAGKPIFFYDFGSVLSSDVLAQLPFTLSSYHKQLPGTIVATFENEPALYLLTTSDSKQLPIGSKGTIVHSDSWPADLPTVNISLPSEEIYGGDSIDSLPQSIHQPLSNLINSLYKYQIVFQNVEWISGDEIRVVLETDQQVILSEDNPALAVEKLDLILNSKEVDALEEQINEIDLRFKMPILRTNQ